MKLAISLLFVLLFTLTTVAFAGEAELSDIDRPVDAQAQALDEETFSASQVAMDVQAEVEGPHRLENI